MFLELTLENNSRAGKRGTSAAEKLNKDLTYQVIGGDDDAANEQNGRRDSIVRPEDHVVDDSLVDQVSHLHKAGDRRHQAENRHFRSVCKNPVEKKHVIFIVVNGRLSSNN